MNPQSQQNTGSVDSGPTLVQPGQFNHDTRPFVAGFPLAPPPVNGRDGNVPAMPNLFGGLNLQNQRPGSSSKYNTIKGNMGMAPNFDLSGAQRPPYNGQFFLYPNAPMFSGLPQVAPFGPASVSEQGQIPYFPTNVFPNLNPGCPMVPGPVQGYSWPYLMNYDVQDHSGHKRNWGSSDEHKPMAPSTIDSGSHPGFYQNPVTSNVDGSAAHGGPFTVGAHLTQPILPYQMMKTASGYILQDLEVLTQQEPPIPRAVPAMWTNPSDLTLAKCLENREGITNVYIRGFLPETTDDMLYSYASRFGKIDRCKAIVDLDTGMCKG